ICPNGLPAPSAGRAPALPAGEGGRLLTIFATGELVITSNASKMRVGSTFVEVLARRVLIHGFLVALAFLLQFCLFGARHQQVIGLALALAGLPGAALPVDPVLRVLHDLLLAGNRLIQLSQE